MNTYIELCQVIVAVLAACGAIWVGERIAGLAQWIQERQARKTVR